VHPPRARHAVVALLVVVLLPACASWGVPGSTPGVAGKLFVVATEDMWGSLARQLGGDRVIVESLVANPAADPHDYEPTPSDARAMASAGLVIANGLGYDEWATKMLAANPADGRLVLDVGHALGLERGANPHQWYSPGAVTRVVSEITSRYQRLDAAHAEYYERQRVAFEASALARYTSLLASIRSKYAGTAIGATESVVAPLAEELGLRLVTPRSFLSAVAEGSDPTAAATSTVDRQIASKEIKVFVFNAQNATPDVQRLVAAAQAAGVPVVTITETLTPQGATFQDWQARQLESLEAALATGTGR
jgi:zinc/manganese transport system substrate-binding protein